jgi:hypothetical protein
MQGVEQDGAAWVTLAEAARRDGVSIDTVRRRMKRGELEARQVPTRHGLAWQVRLGELQGGVPTVGEPPMQPAQGVDSTELVRLVRDQQQTIMELSGRVGYLQAELTQARERILALEAPKAEPVAVEPVAATEAVPEPATRPWWRRMWRAVQV